MTRSVAEKIAFLEGLLEKVRSNAAKPRAVLALAPSAEPAAEEAPIAAAEAASEVVAPPPSDRQTSPVPVLVDEPPALEEAPVAASPEPPPVIGTPTPTPAPPSRVETKEVVSLEDEAAPKSAPRFADEETRPAPELSSVAVSTDGLDAAVEVRSDVPPSGAELDLDLAAEEADISSPGVPSMAQLGNTIELEESTNESLELNPPEAPRASDPIPEELDLPSMESPGRFDESLAPPAEASEALRAHDPGPELALAQDPEPAVAKPAAQSGSGPVVTRPVAPAAPKAPLGAPPAGAPPAGSPPAAAPARPAAVASPAAAKVELEVPEAPKAAPTPAVAAPADAVAMSVGANTITRRTVEGNAAEFVKATRAPVPTTFGELLDASLALGSDGLDIASRLRGPFAEEFATSSPV